MTKLRQIHARPLPGWNAAPSEWRGRRTLTQAQPPPTRSLVFNPQGSQVKDAEVDTKASQDQDVIFNRRQSSAQGPPSARAATQRSPVRLHCNLKPGATPGESSTERGPETRPFVAQAFWSCRSAFLHGFAMQVPLIERRRGLKFKGCRFGGPRGLFGRGEPMQCPRSEGGPPGL